MVKKQFEGVILTQSKPPGWKRRGSLALAGSSTRVKRKKQRKSGQTAMDQVGPFQVCAQHTGWSGRKPLPGAWGSQKGGVLAECQFHQSCSKEPLNFYQRPELKKRVAQRASLRKKVELKNREPKKLSLWGGPAQVRRNDRSLVSAPILTGGTLSSRKRKGRYLEKNEQHGRRGKKEPQTNPRKMKKSYKTEKKRFES